MIALGNGADGDPTLHPVLARQLRRLRVTGNDTPSPDVWASFLARVSAAYTDADQRFYLSERALEVSSGEMQVLHDQLQSSQIRRTAVFDTASVGLCVLDADGRIEDVNPAALSELGREQEQLVGRSLWDAMSVVSERDASTRLDAATFAVARDSLVAWREDDAVVTSGTRNFLAACVLTPLVATDGRFTGAVLVLRDITQHKRAQAELAWRATHDALTGLPNRSRIMSMLTAAIDERRSDRDRPLTVLFVDLDRFKAVNDAMGHAAGDGLLRQVVRRIANASRSTDLVGRLAGDEFVVVSDVDRTSAVRMGERIIDALEKPVVIDGRPVSVSASVGVAAVGPRSTAASVLAEADRAMYKAKQTGRGRVCVFADDRPDVALTVDDAPVTSPEDDIEDDLRTAVRAHGLDVAYQVELDLTTGCITGFEVLSRWSRAATNVPPSVFIPLAEQTGLIHDLGEAVFGAAASAIARWAGPSTGIHLSVNVSAAQLRHPHLAAQIATLLELHGVDPAALTIEVSELALVAEPDIAPAALSSLKELGVRLAIDDFGTGGASLTMLRSLSVDDVKLDAAFVGSLIGDDAGRVVLASVIDICHALELRVVAEGVETAELADELKALGCDAALGWHFGQPGDEEDARSRLDAAVR